MPPLQLIQLGLKAVRALLGAEFGIPKSHAEVTIQVSQRRVMADRTKYAEVILESDGLLTSRTGVFIKGECHVKSKAGGE